MNAPLILRLVGLRYKLLWAQTRTRNGRIALFLAGYLFAVLILILMTAGGYGAAMIAVRSGQAEKVAQAVLGGLFVNALIASVVTGFGINTAFTDAALRRYALSPQERLAARHLTGILEPVWIFVLGLYLGLSTGMYVFGAGGFWLGAAAVLLLLITDYLLARVLATLIEWLSHVKGGTAILFLMLMCVCLLPGYLIPRLANAHGAALGAKAAMLAVLHYTPPFAAAALMANASAGLLHQPARHQDRRASRLRARDLTRCRMPCGPASHPSTAAPVQPLALQSLGSGRSGVWLPDERSGRMRVGLSMWLAALMILILRCVYPHAPRLVVDAVERAHGLLASMAH